MRECDNGLVLLHPDGGWFVRCACRNETDPAPSKTQAKKRQREHRYPGPNPRELGNDGLTDAERAASAARHEARSTDRRTIAQKQAAFARLMAQAGGAAGSVPSADR